MGRVGYIERILVIALLATGAGGWCVAGETDQYMTWGIVLDDSAEAINAFINDEIERVGYLVKRIKPIVGLSRGPRLEVYFIGEDH